MQELKPLRRPHGLAEITATFGDINSYLVLSENSKMSLDPRFECNFISTAFLLYPLLPVWDNSRTISSIRCHVFLAERFLAVFEKISRLGLSDKAQFFGGCFNFRPKRNGTGLSTHSWGIAIDLNPVTNAKGGRGDMDPGVIAIFEEFGFIWGGDWPGRTRDPMHFQYCSGY